MKGEAYLKKPIDFARLHHEGRRLGGRVLSTKSLPNGLAYGRWGIVVSKKLGKSVVRNRIKRRIREVLRQAKVKAGIDIIIIARAGAAAADYNELKQEALGLLRRGGLVEINENTGHASN